MNKVIIYFSVFLLFLFVECSSVYAGVEEGLAAYDCGDYETALQEYKPLAEQGDADGQYNLGLLYASQGVTQDYAEAFKWYKKAAEQGFVDAQLWLNVYDG